MTGAPQVLPARETRARARDPFLALALLLALLAALPLLVGPGIVNTRAGGDAPFLLQRVQGLSANLRAGALPARWMLEGAHGLGYPFFTFYAALPYYLAAALDVAGLGVLWGIKLTQTLGFLLAGLGAYLLARRLGAGRPWALLASAAYTFAPFHLVNVYVRGDALSEFYAQALYPLVLLAATHQAERPSAPRAALLGAAYALLVLSHNISAVVFSPLLLVWVLVGAWRQPAGKARLRALAWGLGALALGLWLSVWFWLPALRQQPLVQLQEQTTGYFHFAGHFRALATLVQRALLHDYAIDAARDPFAMGLAQAGVALLGLLALLWRLARRRRLDAYAALGALALVGYTWLITPSSRVVWDHVPLLPYAQFPWRLLSVQALLVAVVLATGQPEPGAGRARGVQTLGALALAALLAVAGLGALRVDRLPLLEAEVTPERLMLYETYSGNIGSTIRHEYLPAEMVPAPQASARQLMGEATPLALEGALAGATLLERAPGRETWEVDVAQAALVALPTTFFPGWTIRVDGAPAAVQPLDGLGLVGVRLPEGAHRVALAYRGTRTERYALWVTLGGAVVWLGLLLWPARRSRRLRLCAGVALGGAVLGLGWLALAPALGVQAARGDAAGPLVMDFVRAPYLHAEPDGVLLGEARLVGYHYAEEAAPGGALEIALAWEGSGPMGREVRVTLRAATAHLYEPAPTWAVASAALTGPQQTLRLALPADLPPGLYVPHLEVLREGTPEPVRAGSGAPMGTPGLAPVRVLAARWGEGEAPALATYGPEHLPPVVSLLGAEVLPAEGHLAEVRLEWRAERQAPRNYVLSVRLLDPSGAQVASRDLPPLLGGYPTSLWRHGEVVTDRVLLALPEGQTADALGVEVVLYDRQTLQAAGTYRAP